MKRLEYEQQHSLKQILNRNRRLFDTMLFSGVHNISFIQTQSNLWPSATRDKFNISLAITITTRDIFQYQIPTIVYSPNKVFPVF